MASVMTTRKKKYEDCPYGAMCGQGHSERMTDTEKLKYDDKVRCHECSEAKYTPKLNVPQAEEQPAAPQAEEQPAEAPASG